MEWFVGTVNSTSRLSGDWTFTGPGLVRVIGPGVSELAGDASGPARPRFDVDGGLTVNGDLGTPIHVVNGFLSGTGTVASISTASVGCRLAPGFGGGTLTCSNVNLNSLNFYVAALDNPSNPGQLRVHGAVTLGNAKLNLVVQDPLPIGTPLVIIDRSGPAQWKGTASKPHLQREAETAHHAQRHGLAAYQCVKRQI